jgi:ubiquitin carboxyl-terminal hydrolase 9/13
MSYPRKSPLDLLNGSHDGVSQPSANGVPSSGGSNPVLTARAKAPAMNSSARNPGGPAQSPKPEDKEAPDVKKKVALAKGPVLNMDYDSGGVYGMPESLFTSLKNIFEAISAHNSRIGVVSPTRFLEILRRDYEMFRTSMHQDAHEFLNIVLNEVVANVEVKEKRLEAERETNSSAGTSTSETAPATKVADGSMTPTNTGWVHELFEGTLTSETKCLTCEHVSQRDEVFLDLSVDLEQHSSVTSCLRKFSEEEMLCERNKFHCDRCGGLQEAEKRMKIKRLPKILALHLKRFKYTEDLQRLQKLFHRVVYPYHLRLFNTTDDAEDPDRLYELYAVVVHIGGGPYHGHYVSIVKTQDRGWLLFDDEMVEPVDKNFVRNFFGDRPGLACAYVLFYQETTVEAVKREQAAEPLAAVPHAVEAPTTGFGLGLKANGLFSNGMHLSRAPVLPTTEENGPKEGLKKVATEPLRQPPSLQSSSENTIVPIATTPTNPSSPISGEVQSKKERLKVEKERKGTEKVHGTIDRGKRKTLDFLKKDNGKWQAPDARLAEYTNGVSPPEKENIIIREVDLKNGSGTSNGISAGLNRFRQTSKSLRRPKLWGSREPVKDEPAAEVGPTAAVPVPEKPETIKSRFSHLRRKKSGMLL